MSLKEKGTLMPRLMTLFTGLPMTIVSGICLAASLLLIVLDCHVWYDPAWITIVISGLPLLYLAIHRLICQHSLSSAMLISIALVACLSIGQLFAAGEVAWIMAVGALLEDYSVARARRGITRCASLMPLTARRVGGDGVTHTTVPLSDIRVGDILRVVPGEQIPTDGIIVAGETTINQAIMPGEAIPVDKTCGDSVFCGLPLLYLAIQRLICQHWLSSVMLISIALVACLSIGQLFAAGEVAWIMAVGALLEDYSVARARRGITRCASLMPLTARRVGGDGDCVTHATVPLSDIRVGDILRVVPGEQIPIDGIIVAGETTINQAIMTGEAIPVDKRLLRHNHTPCGNGLGTIDIRATHLPQDTALTKMIALVEDAQTKKAPMQRLADKWATYLVPIALIIAVLAGLLTGQWQRAVTVLVVFCPCALALATPVAIVAGIAQATTRGIIIKSGEALERMGHVDTIAFDKTGTLTQGTLAVTDIIPATGYSVEALLLLTASLEALSEHPIAQAITHYQAITTALLPVKAFTISPGRGVTGITVDEHDTIITIVCGNSTFLEEMNIAVPDDALQSIAALQEQSKAIVLTAVNGSYAGVIALADTIRPTAPTLIRELTTMGIHPVMLTGDNTLAAQHVAQQVAITTVKANLLPARAEQSGALALPSAADGRAKHHLLPARAEQSGALALARAADGRAKHHLLPADKVSVISALQQEGHTVAMVGDGVNDAAALTTAHVGIAMAAVGSNIAIDAADIALMGDNIQRIPYLVRLAKAVRRSITVNISLSMAINAIAITLSTLGLLTRSISPQYRRVGWLLPRGAQRSTAIRQEDIIPALSPTLRVRSISSCAACAG